MSLQICHPLAMAVTAATPQVWKAVKQDLEKVLKSPVLRGHATMTKQVCFEELRAHKQEHISFYHK